MLGGSPLTTRSGHSCPETLCAAGDPFPPLCYIPRASGMKPTYHLYELLFLQGNHQRAGLSPTIPPGHCGSGLVPAPLAQVPPDALVAGLFPLHLFITSIYLLKLYKKFSASAPMTTLHVLLLISVNISTLSLIAVYQSLFSNLYEILLGPVSIIQQTGPHWRTEERPFLCRGPM